jgi:low affinity Fe/Cu permease
MNYSILTLSYPNATFSYPNLTLHWPSLTLRLPRLALCTPSCTHCTPSLPPITVRHAAFVIAMASLAVTVATVTLAAGHVELLARMPIFQGATPIAGVTELLDKIKGYLISIVLAGFTVAGLAVGAAKLTGHSRANDMIFNTGVGIAIFAALPTLVA